MRRFAAKTLSIVCMALFSAPAASQDASSARESVRSGWHFYDDPDAPPEPTRAPAPAPAPTPKESSFEAMQQRFQMLRNRAILDPTEQKVQQYLEYEKAIVDRASLFAEVAQRVAWRVPALDPASRGRPVNYIGQQVFDAQQHNQRAERVAKLAVDHALLFAFRGDCPFCHAFAPVLAAFSRRYGIKVVAVSMDGGALPEYPEPRGSAGLDRVLGITQVPALYLLNPGAGTAAPVGVGILSEGELLERLSAVADGAEAVAVVPPASIGRTP